MRLVLAVFVTVATAATAAGCCCAFACPPSAPTPPPEVTPAPVEAVPAPAEEPQAPDPGTAIVIRLHGDGAFVARHGEAPDAPLLAEGDLGAAAGKEVQEASLGRLRDAVQKLAGAPGTREDDGSPEIPVLILGDRAAKWVYVQWIMQVMAHPDVRIYKMQFRVNREDETPQEGDE